MGCEKNLLFPCSLLMMREENEETLKNKGLTASDAHIDWYRKTRNDNSVFNERPIRFLYWFCKYNETG